MRQMSNSACGEFTYKPVLVNLKRQSSFLARVRISNSSFGRWVWLWARVPDHSDFTDVREEIVDLVPSQDLMRNGGLDGN